MKTVINNMKYLKLFEKFESDSFELKIDIEDFIEKICVKLDISYSIFNIIGEGGNGVAIDIGDYVIKLTTDISEAYYANKLIDIDSKHLIKIYDVYRLESDDVYGELYLIIEEKLNTNIIETIKTFLYYLHKRNPITNRINDISDEEVLDYMRPKMLALSDNNILLLFNKYKDVYNEAMKYDIPLNDFHGSNVGFRYSNGNGTDLVYFDISDPYESYDLNIHTLKI
jgi:hypothetical protein